MKCDKCEHVKKMCENSKKTETQLLLKGHFQFIRTWVSNSNKTESECTRNLSFSPAAQYYDKYSMSKLIIIHLNVIQLFALVFSSKLVDTTDIAGFSDLSNGNNMW